ncbi:proline racemase family protein [Gordonia sp. (in: high G+C Gram-positive bacteria)]|uniref:proline racemase family protein n=1 Tax=Gordonia sp. (in: high G+C Gram-positive bacteria) TaxID=84139 RepID=UPI002633AC6B|nr:proline racemase family protein [Gordonia sp. (in: high G+C Gram-positive bacteria)]
MRLARMINAVDVHADGLPGRVITGGVGDVPGDTMLAKARHLETEADGLRKLMLNEPRGYPGMCANLVLPSNHPDADYGYVIMEHVEYPAMSGSNTICVATVLIETGMVPVTEPVTEFTLEAPAGPIRIRATVEHGKATSITFRNQPAYAAHLDVPVEIPGIGTVTADIAWGGMCYAIADADQFGLSLLPEEGRRIVECGQKLTLAAREQYDVVHPVDPSLAGVSISQLSGPPHRPENHRRNAVTMPSGLARWDAPGSFLGCIDRSPCGTGTSAKMATLHARGRLGVGEEFRHESITGTVFTGRIVEETTLNGVPAIIPEITGHAWITGFASYVLDPTDPFPAGLTVGDIWAQV